MAELITVVDENDKPLKGEDRKTVHSSTMWHRGIHVFVFNSQGEVLVQLRSTLKDKYPDTYDCSISGQVAYGEQYEEAAIRELAEELGIKVSKLIPAIHFRMPYGPSDYHVCELFECVYDGKIRPNEEVSEIKFLGMNDLKKLIAASPEMFTPWFVEILKWYFKEQNNLIMLP
jgi:isopentenyl-diphosphate delta-isomerase type 1